MANDYNDIINTPATRRWQLDKSIPLALIVMFAIQTVSGAWWMSGFAERTAGKIEVLEKQQALLVAIPEKMGKQEAQISAVLDGMKGLRDDVRDIAGRRTRP